MGENQPTREEAIKERKGAYASHFDRELEIMRKQVEKDDELIIEPYVDAVKGVCDAFAEEGHSGGSAPMAAGVIASTIKAVLGFQILSPLTGDDNEWNDISMTAGKKMWQNNRDSAVFKDEDGKCTFNNCIVWKGEESWDTFTGSVEGIRSSHYLKGFPFMPKTFFIDVVREVYDKDNPNHSEENVVSCNPEDVVYFIKDKKQLEEVFNYYNKRELN